MKTLVAIGEALIDFAPQQAGRQIKDTESFMPKVGGAPANVCGAYAKLGGKAVMLTQLGADPFGDKIVEELAHSGIDTTYISRTEEANTSLAFVALLENGDREFTFFRKPGADMLYRPEQVPEEVFADAYALHFCSVSLGDYPMKQAHKKAIEKASAAGVMISFDPNLRPQLWPDQAQLKAAVTEFLPCADILKLSDEELFHRQRTYCRCGGRAVCYGNLCDLIYERKSGGGGLHKNSARGCVRQWEKGSGYDRSGRRIYWFFP